MYYVLYNCRGESFRPEYKNLSVLRSIIKTGVPFMAMTATASVCTKDTVMQCLRMSTITTAMIDESPDKPNIFYGVMDNMAADVLTHHIAEGIKTMGSRYPKTLVFCRRYEF